MKSYMVFMVLILWDVKLRILTPTSFGCKNLNVEKRNGNNILGTFSLLLYNVFSLLIN
jgi:hypothetical protein